MTKRGDGESRGDIMARQYREGRTLREIADLHKISPQAVSRSLQRRGASPTYDEWRARVSRAQRAPASRRERKDRK
ncbi:hypothetical protein F1640_18560 [Novosphingobium sp. NBM11]|uniref:hypothetical protein n=1 Tax=Novosphingobium sp. NBM11 TaxID=2596914 RepID=UPI0018925F75|nr:hypothetical protein [Novosphingobium sp. NBM11]MBF5091958.1 hypothetical protein [Novosphingobium sp. NBM11]